MNTHDSLGLTLVSSGAAILVSFITAFVVMKLLPRLRFKGDKPLDSYTGIWAKLMPVLALVLAGASVALVITQELPLIWYLPLAPLSGLLAVLTLTDIRHRRLPNGVMAILYIMTIITVPLAIILSQEWEGFARFGIAFGAAVVVFLILAFTGMGGGDLKLIPPVFAILAAMSWEIAIGWMLISWVCGGLWALGEAIARRSFKGKMPFIPGFTIGFIILSPFLMLEPFLLFSLLF